MGEQFDDLAALRTRALDGPTHELLADAAAAMIGGDADVLDQAARRPLRAQPWQDAKLQAADDTARLLRDHQLDIGIALDPLEGVEIELRQRLLQPFARAAKMIVGEHCNDGDDIVAARTTDGYRIVRVHAHVRYRAGERP